MILSKRRHLLALGGAAAALWATGLLGCPAKEQAFEQPLLVLVDAGAPPDAGVSYTWTARLTDGGEAIIQPEPGSFASLDPALEIRFTAQPALEDFRVRIYDEVQRALVSDDTWENQDGGTWYRAQLTSPLKSGHQYTVVVEGQSSAEEVVDSTGKRHGEYRLPLQITGDKVKDLPPPPPSSKKKRRRG